MILHGNVVKKKLKQGQAHVDLICAISDLVCDLPVMVTFIYVPGHRDKHVPYELLTIEQQLNCDMDRLAKKVLKRAIKKNTFIISAFFSEPLTVFDCGHKVICSPTEAIYDSEGRKSAWRYFSMKNRIHPADFDLVDFQALG